MQVRTVSVTLFATREVVFNFLADIENLPKWATEYCERLELRRDGWLAYTSQGEMRVKSEAEDHSGVIDMWMGPSLSDLGLFPLRVLPLSAKCTFVSFTFIQPPKLSDELFEMQYQSLLLAMQRLIRRFGGGELHMQGTVLPLDALGVN